MKTHAVGGSHSPRTPPQTRLHWPLRILSAHGSSHGTRCHSGDASMGLDIPESLPAPRGGGKGGPGEAGVIGTGADRPERLLGGSSQQPGRPTECPLLSRELVTVCPKPRAGSGAAHWPGGEGRRWCGPLGAQGLGRSRASSVLGLLRPGPAEQHSCRGRKAGSVSRPAEGSGCHKGPGGGRKAQARALGRQCRPALSRPLRTSTTWETARARPRCRDVQRSV